MEIELQVAVKNNNKTISQESQGEFPKFVINPIFVTITGETQGEIVYKSILNLLAVLAAAKSNENGSNTTFEKELFRYVDKIDKDLWTKNY